MTSNLIASGGCQCGTVRYAITTPFENPHICHCRMCQKAFGNYFAALVGTNKNGHKWTKGEPAIFKSSEIVVLPEKQFGAEGMLPAFDTLHTLPATRTEDDIPADFMQKLGSRQHPDGST